jgi:cytidylate kinase
MDSSVPLAITISRQLGCGGGRIAHALATRLGFHLADREILEKAAAEFHIPMEDLESREERFRPDWSPLLNFGPFTPDIFMPTTIPISPLDILPTNRELYGVESAIIIKLAAERPCVILGRCGFHVLRHHPRHIAVALHADTDFRIRALREGHGLDPDAARERLETNDRARSEYILECTGHHAFDARSFDLCLETSRIGLDRCVEQIAAYVEAHSAS